MMVYKESPSERIHQLVTLDSDLVVYPSLELSLASDGYSVLSSYHTYFDYRSLATKVFRDELDRPRQPPYCRQLLYHRIPNSSHSLIDIMRRLQILCSGHPSFFTRQLVQLH
jgi:hypothetical protein